MKVFKMYFLAFLVVAFLPLTAQDGAEKESGGETAEVEKKEAAESSDETKEEKKEAEKKSEEASAEEKKEEKKEAKAEEKPEAAEKKEAKAEEKPVKEKEAVVTMEKKEAVADATLKIEDEEDGEEAEDEEKDKDPKKFSVNLTNGFSHGVAKERKSFAYSLTLGASYQLPWKIGMNAGVGFNALYRYDLNSAVPLEDGTQTGDKVEQGVFDGTPLNIGFNRAFLFSGISVLQLE